MTVLEKKRKNMKHLEEMNDLDFVNWIKDYKRNDLPLSWKLDGFFLRFGKDENGTPWFQTARSPVLYDPMAVIWHAMEKGYDHESMTRAEGYFHLIKQIWNSELMKQVADDSAIECEVFNLEGSTYDAFAETRRFVNIPYYDNFFQHEVTLFLYRQTTASTGDVWVRGFVNKNLELDPDIGTWGTCFSIPVDFSYFKEAVDALTPEMLRCLKSLKHVDRPMKLATKEIIRQLKDQLRVYILSKASRQNDMGEYFEGVVMTVNNVEYKITTDYFKMLMAMRGERG